MTPARMLLSLGFFLAAAPAWAQETTLRATLDLRQGLADGWLDPTTETIGLRGDWLPLSWSATTEAADPDGDGIYTLDVPFVLTEDSARVELKIKVDGAGNPNDGWQEGDNHAVVLRRGERAELSLAWGDRPPEAPPLLTGRIDRIEAIEGEGLAPRDVYVWLPPGYDDDPDRRYPVLYLHDGDAKFGTEGGSEWGMDEAAQALVEAGEIEALILVAVANTGARTDEYTPTQRAWHRELRRSGPVTGVGPLAAATGTYSTDDAETILVVETEGGLVAEFPGGRAPLVLESDSTFSLPPDVAGTLVRDAEGAITNIVVTRPPAGGLGDAYGRLLTDTIKPLIDARYRTRPDAASTGLGGSSLGGLITMHLGLTRPDVFGRLIVASPSVWWDDKWILSAVEAAEARPEQRVWVDIGTGEGDSMVPDARALHAALLRRGWDPERVRYVEAEGAGHSAAAWAARARDMLRFLFPPTE